MAYHYTSPSLEMQPLEYKNIGSEKHLTFDSIRRLVLNDLSDLSEREAKKHIDECYRCNSIRESLVSPGSIRKDISQNRSVPIMIGGIILVFILIGLAASFLYFGSQSTDLEEKAVGPIPEAPVSEDSELTDSEEIAPVLEGIDTLSQINDEPDISDPLAANKQFDDYIENEQKQPIVRLRGIYGRITWGGKPLPGVTVRVPGSNKAKISDPAGKYYIQVPRNARSLIFIYQGKQLVKQLDPNDRRLDIHLKASDLAYPEPRATSPDASTSTLESKQNS